MSDHADTIRRTFSYPAPTVVEREKALAALDALLAERQQAQEGAERLRGVVNQLHRDLDAAHTIYVSGVVSEREQQAIDALRRLLAVSDKPIPPDSGCDCEVCAASTAAYDLLVKLGEKP